MNKPLPADARARLDAHLDAVDRVLRSTMRPREQRRAVVDDLETQILDMLARRFTAPTRADMDALLAQLDPPEAYGPAPSATPAPQDPPPPSPAPPPIAPQAPANPIRPVLSDIEKSERRSYFMRPIVLVTLIICGTLLILTPTLFNLFEAQQIMYLMRARTDMVSFNLANNVALEPIARFGLWLTGTMAIAGGIIGGFVGFWRETRPR